MGRAAVPALVAALSNKQWHVRWEAAYTLVHLGDPSAADALVAAMGDEHIGVAWLAAEALIGLGQAALEPLLKALLQPGNVAPAGDTTHHVLRVSAAHHVLRVFARKKGGEWLIPLLAALDSHQPGIAVPLAALRALKQLRTMNAGGARKPLASGNLA